MAASRHVQDVDLLAMRRSDASGAHVPTLVDLDALTLAPLPVSRPPAVARVASARPALPVATPEREPTFDELLSGAGAHVRAADGGAAPRGRAGRFHPRRAARAGGGAAR